MPKRATAIRLNEQEQEALTRLVRRHRSEQQVALRARIVLAAAQGSSNIQIARELGISRAPVREAALNDRLRQDARDLTDQIAVRKRR